MRRAALVALLGVVLAGCGDRSVTTDEIDDLEDLEDVRVTVSSEVFHVFGEDVRTGDASGRGERVDFAVLVGEDTPERLTVGGRSYRLVSGCAGAGFYARTDRFSTVSNTVESAVYDKLAPDAYCEG
jgi:hypothetical protein